MEGQNSIDNRRLKRTGSNASNTSNADSIDSTATAKSNISLGSSNTDEPLLLPHSNDSDTDSSSDGDTRASTQGKNSIQQCMPFLSCATASPPKVKAPSREQQGSIQEGGATKKDKEKPRSWIYRLFKSDNSSDKKYLLGSEREQDSSIRSEREQGSSIRSGSKNNSPR